MFGEDYSFARSGTADREIRKDKGGNEWFVCHEVGKSELGVGALVIEANADLAESPVIVKFVLLPFNEKEKESWEQHKRFANREKSADA